MQYQSLFIASLGFLVIHFVSVTNIRAAVVKRIGKGGWSGLFSLLSFGFFGWMCFEYWQAERVEDLWVLPSFWLWINALMMAFGIGLIVLCNFPDKDALIGKGVFAITRHPMNWGMGFFAASHMISNPSVEAQLFWGSILGTGLIGSYFLDKRKIREGQEKWLEGVKKSSWLPFWALYKKRTTIAFEDFKMVPLSLAVGVFFIAMILHVAFFATYILPL